MPTSTRSSLVIPRGNNTSVGALAPASGGPGVRDVLMDGRRIGISAAATRDGAAKTTNAPRAPSKEARRSTWLPRLQDRRQCGRERIVLHWCERHVVEACEEHVVVDNTLVVVLVESALVSVRPTRRDLFERVRQVVEADVADRLREDVRAVVRVHRVVGRCDNLATLARAHAHLLRAVRGVEL